MLGLGDAPQSLTHVFFQGRHSLSTFIAMRQGILTWYIASCWFVTDGDWLGAQCNVAKLCSMLGAISGKQNTLDLIKL
jgi:hypothetical protein